MWLVRQLHLCGCIDGEKMGKRNFRWRRRRNSRFGMRFVVVRRDILAMGILVSGDKSESSIGIIVAGAYWAKFLQTVCWCSW